MITAFHIISYMAAPVSMCALVPRTRVFGLVVFVVLTLLLNTVQVETQINMVLY